MGRDEASSSPVVFFFVYIIKTVLILKFIHLCSLNVVNYPTGLLPVVRLWLWLVYCTATLYS